MNEVRLTAAIEISALLRRVAADGDFGAVVRQGDSERGSLLLIITSRGKHITCLQRQLDFTSGAYQWAKVGPESNSGSREIAEFLAAQTRFDPDSWQIELDIARPERFIAETIGSA